MALLKDLYEFTKYVDSVNGTPDVLQFNAHHDEAWIQYANTVGISREYAKRLGMIAQNNRYVTYMPLNERDGPPHKLVIDDNGLELTHRTAWGLIPKGLWLAWLDKNKSLTALIVSFMSGVIIGIIGLYLAYKGLKS